MSKENNQIDDIRLKAKLNDSQQQKGVSWRKTKIEAVAEARKKGKRRPKKPTTKTIRRIYRTT